ncbi:MAG: hypothetical protein IJT71_04610, partial [Oscillospiraceae bacterium]|nr:hypothetical protein [Oscillospiraceae bacterium]
TDGVEPHFATEVYLAVLPVDGGEAELSLLGGSVESMQLDGGYLTLLTRDDLTDVMSLRVLRGGEVVYERRGPDFVAAGVSDGKLYYVLK